MKERFIGGFFVALITLIALLSGGYVTAVILTVVSIVGIWEYLRIYKLEKSSFAVIDYIFTVIYYGTICIHKDGLLLPLILVMFMVLLAFYVFHFPNHKDSDVGRALFIFIYITVMLSYVLRIREMDAGMYLAFYLLIASWGNDVCAYFIGRAFGKHKFSPVVSPNKSVEGFIGGIAGAFIIGFLYAMVFPNQIPFTKIYGGLVAAIAAIPSVIGDLAASAIKRDHGIKDYSNLIPGHGGIIDRFDSVIYIAPIIYWLVRLVSYI